MLKLETETIMNEERQFRLQKLLRKAIMSCNTERVKNIIEMTIVDVNYTNKKGYLTNLMIALSFGTKEVAELLISRGANVNIILPRKEENHLNKLEIPLMIEVKTRNVGNIKLLLKYGADIYYKDYDGKTVFDYAREENYPEVLKILKRKHKKNKYKLQTILKKSKPLEILNYDCIKHITDFVYSL